MTTRTGRAVLPPDDGTDLLDGRPMQVEASGEFVLIQYNIHSLINFEERMEKLLFELSGRHLDVIVFSETWRGAGGTMEDKVGPYVVWKWRSQRF